MENPHKNIKPILQSLKLLVEENGGNSALSDSKKVAKITADLKGLHPDMNEAEITFVTNVINSLKPNN